MAFFAVAARRPFSRIRLSSTTQKLSQFQSRSFASTPFRRELLGLQRQDLRSLKESRPAPKRRPHIVRPNGQGPPTIKVYPPLPSTRARCKEPVLAFEQAQLKRLDPTGARQRLFSARNLEGAKVGDILMVRQKGGDPFAGVCINIRRQGVDTAILLRNQLTRVGVEMWFKVYSPNVEGVEVVQRREKRARRARLYYMRQEKHDRGSVQNIMDAYLRQRSALRTGEARGRDANANKRKSKGR